MLPAASPKPASRRAWGVELGRWLASALLLLSAGLGVAALFLPWSHYTNGDGSPLPNPSDAEPFVPMVTLGLRNSMAQGLLGFMAVAGMMGLVALVLPRRRPDALEAPASVAAIMSLLGFGLAFLGGIPWFSAAPIVRDIGYDLYLLSCALILVGVWALVNVMRRSRALATHAAGTPLPALDHEGV